MKNDFFDFDDVFVVVPAFNEGKNIGSVLSLILDEGFRNVVVVDDGSSDDTFFIAKSFPVVVLRHAVNLGKGCALKTGTLFSLKHDAKVIVFIDSDLQHDPKDIKRFLKVLYEKDVDVVFAFRNFDSNMPFVFRLGNFFIDFVFKFLFGKSIRDTQNGFKVFKSNIFKFIEWNSCNYSVETEIAVNTVKNNLSFFQVNIDTVYIDKYKGTTIFDGFKIVKDIFWFKIKR